MNFDDVVQIHDAKVISKAVQIGLAETGLVSRSQTTISKFYLNGVNSHTSHGIFLILRHKNKKSLTNNNINILGRLHKFLLRSSTHM